MEGEGSGGKSVNAIIALHENIAPADTASLGLDVCYPRSYSRECNACSSHKLERDVLESWPLDCLIGVADFDGHVASLLLSTSAC